MATQPTDLGILCNICNVAAPKYTCPRCSTRTCSLQCIQKHKTRMDCSGVRNPAEFVPKSQLLTPTVFDRDYNFISSVERRLTRNVLEGGEKDRLIESEQKPDRKDKRRGGRRAPHHKGNQIVRKHQTGAWLRRLEKDEITAILGPMGMQRQRDNKSKKSLKTQELLWTVEWIFDQDETILSHGVPHMQKVGDAFRAALKKRTRAKQPDPNHADKVAPKDVHQSAQGDMEPGHQIPTEPEPEPSIEEPPEETDQQRNKDSTQEGQTDNLVSYASSRSSSPSSESSSSLSSSTTTSRSSTPEPCSAYTLHLLKPRTTGTTQILIPIDPSEPLSAVLRRRTVLEFPTLVALSRPAAEHGERYQLEADYAARLGGLNREMAALVEEGERELGAEQGRKRGRGEDREEGELRGGGKRWNKGKGRMPKAREESGTNVPNGQDISAILAMDVFGQGHGA